ncbi:hypothetical protein [Methanogenium cariaci]
MMKTEGLSPPFFSTIFSPSANLCSGESESNMDVFFALFSCRKMATVIPFIYKNDGLLQITGRLLLAGILRGCMGRLGLRLAPSGLLFGHRFSGRGPYGEVIYTLLNEDLPKGTRIVGRSLQE